MKRRIVLVAALALSACVPGLPGVRISTTPPGSPPLVTAAEGSSASMTLIACPPSERSNDALLQTVQSLSSQSPIVTAEGGGNSRLTLNFCGGYGQGYLSPPPLPSGARTR